MAIPKNATAWPSPMDPADYKDYVAEWGAVLQEGETISTFDVTMSAEGIALGVSIDAVTHPPAKVDDDKNIVMWPMVDPLNQGDAEWDGDGTQVAIEITITTSMGRDYQKTWVLTVQQQ